MSSIAVLIKSTRVRHPLQSSNCNLPSQYRTPPAERFTLFHSCGTRSKGIYRFRSQPHLTRADLSRRLGEGRREARVTYSQYSQDFGHKMFGSS
ncbi:hypothetical protein BJV77DRAFT_1057359, partial [Russula vinacea]